MKTFKWTVPTPPLSRREKESYREKDILDDSFYSDIPTNWYEKMILKKVLTTNSYWPYGWPIGMALLYTFIYPPIEGSRVFTILWWGIVVFSTFEYFRNIAVKRMLMRTREKIGEQALLANDRTASDRG
ncbi:MAG: hypothetical protein P1U58_03815 [Verrucomicrobiales bacterium]|nr:hypothetical protein [Verrucomicrobiales bacterium]